VIDIIQLILVEPDAKRLGWGVVRFVGFLQVRKLTLTQIVYVLNIVFKNFPSSTFLFF